jgi:hypothetical protein
VWADGGYTGRLVTWAKEKLKGTDLTVRTNEHLDAVAAELNGPPRKTLGWETPAEHLRNRSRPDQHNHVLQRPLDAAPYGGRPPMGSGAVFRGHTCDHAHDVMARCAGH